MKTTLYIHYPFCQRKCLYCSFNSTDDVSINPEEYCAGILREMELRSQTMGDEIAAVTLYFGGGTPSLMDPSLAERLIMAARRIFRLTADAEVTLECNPGTVKKESLAAFRSAGVNRISLGAQSFHDFLLSGLGRLHSAADALEAVGAVRDAGFGNVGIDLIHSIPGQSAAMWESDLERACALELEHISVYGLTVEEGTPFARQEREGGLQLPDEDQSAAMYEMASEFLVSRGFEHYEIANFARPGFRSRHNSGYWQRLPCLGFGAGAHSFLPRPGNGIRFSNAEGISDYLRSLAEGTLPVSDSCPLSRREAMAERLFLGLRLSEGVNLSDFLREFGVPFEEAFGPACGPLFSAGLLEIRDGCLILPPRARILSNQVFARLL